MEDTFRWNEPILSGTQTKRQHYVPRTYLHPFAGKDDLIRVVNLDQTKEYRTSVVNVAVEGRFYDIEIEGVVTSAEEWLAQTESDAAPVVKRLIAKPASIETLTVEEEIKLARFIASLHSRTPAFRDWLHSTTSSTESQIKDKLKGSFIHQYGEDGEDMFAEWESEWEKDQPTPAALSLRMLAETPGFANFVWGAPWRIGVALGSRSLYTSDNPVSRNLRPIRPWREVGGFASFEYYLPLSPNVLLKIERRPDLKDTHSSVTLRGQRRKSDFTEWEVSMARHIVSLNAARYLYGEGLIVPKQCAEACLSKVESAMREFAKAYLGFAPNPPIGTL